MDNHLFKELLQKELKQIEKESIKINGYPKWVSYQINEECRLPINADYGNNQGSFEWMCVGGVTPPANFFEICQYFDEICR